MADSPAQYNFRLTDPCPCEGGKVIKDCCLFMGKYLRKEPQDVAPRPPPTNHAHPNCYLNGTNDCSASISREHYLSATILEAIAEIEGGPLNAVGVRGMPWQKSDEHKAIGISSLTVSILCDRHNSALSPLDDEAGRFFRRLQAIAIDMGKSGPRPPTLVLFSGEMIERWMLKVILGIHFGGIAVVRGVRSRDAQSIDASAFTDALLGGRWKGDCGLYIRGAGQIVRTPNEVGMAPILSADSQRLVGGIMQLMGLELLLLFDPVDTANGAALEAQGHWHRPEEIRFETKQRTHSVRLSWLPRWPLGRTILVKETTPPEGSEPTN
ncbi:MAG TPA: hypothetical protein VGG27_13365 [Magnetospirillaceae bacterium]|jgi:hypothetical protein